MYFNNLLHLNGYKATSFLKTESLDIIISHVHTYLYIHIQISCYLVRTCLKCKMFFLPLLPDLLVNFHILNIKVLHMSVYLDIYNSKTSRKPFLEYWKIDICINSKTYYPLHLHFLFSYGILGLHHEPVSKGFLLLQVEISLNEDCVVKLLYNVNMLIPFWKKYNWCTCFEFKPLNGHSKYWNEWRPRLSADSMHVWKIACYLEKKVARPILENMTRRFFS